MGNKLFLDDVRTPKESKGIAFVRFGKEIAEMYLEDGWDIVRNHTEFVEHILNNPMPEVISFDHDLADEHYMIKNENWSEESYPLHERRELTGYGCAKFLIEYCLDNKLELPKCYVHSFNPVGRKNIEDLFKSFNKSQNAGRTSGTIETRAHNSKTPLLW